MAKAGDLLLEAARKQAEGELAVHRANIEVYRTMPAGIGEHSDITEAVIEAVSYTHLTLPTILLV